jgi:hypothetical protein
VNARVNSRVSVALAGRDRTVDPGSLPVGELPLSAAQDATVAVRPIALADAVAVDLLLHAAANLVAAVADCNLSYKRWTGVGA